MSHSEIKGYLLTAKQDNKKLQQLFESYITDTEVPLKERWEAFVNAPRDLTNSGSGTDMFDALPDDFVMHDGAIYADRYQVILTEYIVERIIDEQQHPDVPNRHKEEFMSVDVNALKEEILLKNLGSFEYDW
jgi:hypothetical protein